MAPHPIHRSWAQIDAWLEENAPETFASLPPAADAHSITAVQERLKLRFPRELIQSLLCHDGSGYFNVRGWHRLHSAREIVTVRDMATMLEDQTRSEGTAATPLLRDGYFLWHPQDIPFASDGGGGHLILDARAEDYRGRVGFHDELGTTTFDTHPMWDSLASFLASVAGALTMGNELVGYRREVIDGQLRWESTLPPPTWGPRPRD